MGFRVERMMSRRYESSDSEGDDLPDLSTLLTLPKQLLQKPLPVDRSPTDNDRERPDSRSSSSEAIEYPELDEKASCKERQHKMHKPLRLAHVNSLLLPIANLSLKPPGAKTSAQNARDERAEALRKLSKRIAKKKSPKSYAESDFSEGEEDRTRGDEFYEDTESNSIDEPEDDLSDFIVNDSASEDELRRPRQTKEDTMPLPRRRLYQKTKRRSSLSPRHDWVGTLLPDRSGKDESHGETKDKESKTVEYPRLESFDEPDASLKFSPPRMKSPRKISIPSLDTAITPPPSPSKGLRTPSKTRPKIPPSPHRPSLESFWSQEVVDEWNDQYSPEKTPTSGRFILPESREVSPSPSPSKSPAKNPTKMDKKAIERRKQFESTKHELAASFLGELDDKVTSGQLSILAASTGGVKIIWSKKLNSTAGRANWKREVLRSRSADGAVTNTTSKHHATIELAEKVIDDEDRLLNTIAHEFCHLTNFMISNVKDQPHGASFKLWASKVSQAFKDRNIKVTTKHSYTIAYKYIWACISCKQEYKRHSKSIDPKRHSCSVCKGRLEQVQPVPRGGKVGVGKEGKKGDAGMGYNEYVKKHFKAVKEELERGRMRTLLMGEVSSEVARRYRIEKEREGAKEGYGRQVEREVVVLESDGEDDVEIDDVLEELDGLTLKA